MNRQTERQKNKQIAGPHPKKIPVKLMIGQSIARSLDVGLTTGVSLCGAWGQIF